MSRNYKGKNYDPNYKKRVKVSNRYPYKPKKGKVEIIESEKTIYEKTIDTLINAIRAAKSKNIQQRYLLYDIYDDILQTDDIVTSLLQKRFSNVGNKKIVIVDENDEIVDELKYFVESPKFRSFVQDILSVKLWGFRTFEFGTIKDSNNTLWFDYSLIPNKHINPYTKHILKTQFDENGTQFQDEKGNLKIKNIMFVGDENDLGLMAQISLLSLFQKRGMFNYSKYTDLAGDGFTKIMQRKLTDDENIDRIMKQFEGGRPGTILLPQGDDVKWENTASSQQNSLFEGYMEMLEKRQAKLILSVTETSSDGSSYSQSQVHQSEQDDIFASDIQFISDILNYEFVEYLKLWGFNTENKRFKFIPTSQEEISKRLDDWERIKKLGYVFTNEQIEEKFKDLL